MNLQLNSPYKPCPYKCPFCCAGFVDSSSWFRDTEHDALFFTDRHAYLSRLYTLLDDMNFGTVVITGNTEPTLFRDWIRAVRHILDLRFDGKVEITTRNIAYRGDEDLYAVSYSFDRIPEVVHISRAKITRSVFILNDNLSIDSIIAYHKRTGGQTTVKNMARNSYGNDQVNAWVEKHRVDLSNEEIARLESAGIRYDHDCNNSEGRYMIFRADGNLYNSWPSRVPIFFLEGKENA